MPLPARHSKLLLVAILMAAGGLRAAELGAPPRAPMPPPVAPAGGHGDDQLAQPIAIAGGLVTRELGDQRAGGRVFKGIPYAAPPVGDRRWKPPAAVLPWDGI